jgi:hypothetical protein
LILEFYLIPDGVVHYKAPLGYYKANPELDLRDASYDGVEDENGMLRSGLGLLTDMLYGSLDFSRNHKGRLHLNFALFAEMSTPSKIPLFP